MSPVNGAGMATVMPRVLCSLSRDRCEVGEKDWTNWRAKSHRQCGCEIDRLWWDEQCEPSKPTLVIDIRCQGRYTGGTKIAFITPHRWASP